MTEEEKRLEGREGTDKRAAILLYSSGFIDNAQPGSV